MTIAERELFCHRRFEDRVTHSLTHSLASHRILSWVPFHINHTAATALRSDSPAHNSITIRGVIFHFSSLICIYIGNDWVRSVCRYDDCETAIKLKGRRNMLSLNWQSLIIHINITLNAHLSWPSIPNYHQLLIVFHIYVCT